MTAKSPGWIESAYILLSLLLVTQAMEPLLLFGSPPDDALSDSNPVALISAIAIYTVALVYLIRSPRPATAVVLKNPLLLALFALPLLSVFWSVDPGTTLRRATALMMTGAYCVYIAIRLSPEEFLRRLLIALFIGGVASIIYTAAFPGQAIEHSMINTGSWKGVYGHKAILGRIAAMAVIISIYVKPKSIWQQLVRWCTFGLFLFLSVESQSRASWFMLIGGFGFVIVLAAFRSRRLSNGLKIAVALLIGCVIATAAVNSFEPVLADFGRDETFSGRTTLWHGAYEVAKAQHPILGAGYRAFWTNKGAENVRDYIQDWVRLPNHGHNGYLDVWLDMGIPGVALFVMFLVTTSYRLISRLLHEPDNRSWAAFSIFIFIFVLNNASITVAFKHTDIAWVCAILAALYAHGFATKPERLARSSQTSKTGPFPSYAYARNRQFTPMDK